MGSAHMAKTGVSLAPMGAHGRARRKTPTRRIVARRGERVVNEPPMETSVAVLEGMNVDESERNSRRDHNWIDTHLRDAVIVSHNTVHETLEIFGPRTDMYRHGFLRPPVVRAYKAVFHWGSPLRDAHI